MTDDETMPGEHVDSPDPLGPLRAIGKTLAVVAIVQLAINMRLVFGSASALIGEITDGYRLGSGSAALLTTGPVVCLGVFGVLATRLMARWTVPIVLTGCLALVSLGTALRGVPSWSVLVLGTLLAGIGIAVANVLGPVLVRQLFPHRIGLMTGLLTALVSASAGIASGTTIPLSDEVLHGWRLALLAWALPAVLATVAMGAAAIRHHRHHRARREGHLAPRWRWTVLRSTTAWAVTGFMGLQSLLAYAMIGWLPTIYRDRGISPQDSGLLLTALSAASVVTALITPMVAVRVANQRLVAVSVVGLSALGLAGVATDGTAGAVAWAVLLGLGQGGQLALALTMINLRAATAEITASLSIMSQSIGYLVAATGPLITAALHDATGTWTAPITFLLVAMVPLTVCGWLAADNVHVGSEAPLTETIH